MNELSELHSELVDTVEKLTLQIRNLRSRANMAAAREKKANGATPAEADTLATDGEAAKDRWQLEMNRKIATGEVRLPFRR